MFVGALAARTAAGSSLDEALAFAQAAAALHISTPTARRGGLSAQKVTEFLAAQTNR
jgi:ribokinase